MKQLSDLLRHLQQDLREPQPERAGFRQITRSLALSDASELLPWLATQPVYPQFYWQHRQDREEAAVCGNVCGFRHIQDAEAFLAQQQCDSDVRIWGLNAFNQTKEDGVAPPSYLFLPRAELRRQDDTLSLSINLFSDTSLQQDAVEASAFINLLLPPASQPLLHAEVQSVGHQPERQGWIDLLQRALHDINTGLMEKVVLARATTLTLTQPLQATTFMAASRAANHHCFHFMLAHDARHAFLGSSPERLYRRRGTELETEALAGTVASDRDAHKAAELADWLMNDTKNQCENMLVVDDICQRLQQSALSLDVMPPKIVRLRKVQHLRRTIHATLRTASDSACLNALQPTAAVAGLPRQEARRFIAEHEPFERGWYAGSAGYLSRQQSEFSVALRSAEVRDHVLTLYAGAGIVAGSDPEQEWQELENKAAGLRSLLDGDMS
ncbi:isochorismate synthase MenF [Pectobacterium versatile]|uniref:Isochorismate synthase MenF n=1 Tax=Pectobacterium versatile TaxID=2488639 RepID=A0ABU8JU32_9GAMM|nr:isochorismate synthase MenF [Pectobacterium versatile]MCA5930393.1 isochorismate synthase MenF [Pectobacterium versatile]MCA5947589.1 isochorismate synthase MenF [Pectobacterium versatile]MCA5951915.1 isochorismate synthase MenF [Pectobacterium versatile]TAI93568.1 isochorismate synthase MenF [Pectobacterium versatile]UCP85006.1 isochorismate synthase MenF [Pectobacterium versatile]